MRTTCSRGRPQNSRGKLFIGGLSHDTTDRMLRSYFERFGNLASAEVLRDHHTLNSRGFGFVTFVDEQVAASVYNNGLICPFIIGGKQVEVKMAVPRDPKQPEANHVRREQPVYGLYRASSFHSCTQSSPRRMDDFELPPGFGSGIERKERSPASISSYSSASVYSNVPPLLRVSSMPAMEYEKASPMRDTTPVVANKVFVGGLLYATGHESLRNFFEQFGEVESAEVIYNRDTKKSRGFGFVIFKEMSVLQKVLLQQQYEPLMVDGKPIEVKLCKPKEETGFEDSFRVKRSSRATAPEFGFGRDFFEETSTPVERNLFGDFSGLSLTDELLFGDVSPHRKYSQQEASWECKQSEYSTYPSQWDGFYEEKFDGCGPGLNTQLPRILEYDLN